LALQSIQGDASYISNFDGDPPANTGGLGGNGRIFLSGAPGSNDPGTTGTVTSIRDNDTGKNSTKKKFSYTDFEIRMTDKVTDRLSVTAALRSLGDTSEDPWVGNSGGGLYVREAYAAADLSNFTPLGTKGLNVTIGRQRTKLASGLLYDNQLSPTDQMRADWSIGPVNLTGFFGSSGNQNSTDATNGVNPYASQGAVGYLRADSAVGTNTLIGFPDGKPVNNSVMSEDNESAIRASINLFRISGQPVVLGLNKLADGYGFSEGRGADLTLPLFNRTIGFEYVQQEDYAVGGHAGFINGDKPDAYTVSVPVLKSSLLDLNVAYGHASSDFEFFAISSANPYARTYGDAIFDRPNALGAPMLAANGQFVAAKKTLDVTSTVRLPIGFLRKIPLDLRYYNAKDATGTKLGRVYSLGTKYTIAPGLDIDVKGGIYDPEAGSSKVHYARIGANVGF
jgi:hypothetical protein